MINYFWECKTFNKEILRIYLQPNQTKNQTLMT